jgi:hypothetical protein
MLVVLKSSLIDLKLLKRTTRRKQKMHRERLNEKTTKVDAIVRPTDITE